VTTVEAAASGTADLPDEPCSVYLDADGSRITRLSAHIHPGTGMHVLEYPAEQRAVLRLGQRWSGAVDMYVGAPELARLIDVLNAAYVRVARQPYEEEPAPVTGAA
jgi:hypothetical protein